MNDDLISRSELLGMERLLWCKPYENSKEARNLYEQMMYDIENIPAAMTIPKDFAVKTFEKSVVDDTDVVVIWFDENVWTVEEVSMWCRHISDFLEKSVLMLPKSFSMLEYLTKEQLMDLKRRVDDVAEKIEE